MEISQEAKDRILMIVRKAYAQLRLERQQTLIAEQAVAKYEAEQAALLVTAPADAPVITNEQRASNRAAIKSLFKRSK